MRETRLAVINGKQVPVLISDEKEALLAAKAAGRALIGFRRPGMDYGELSPADYVVEDLSCLTETYLERVVRRHLGLPWKICETERLTVREMMGSDFDEIWENQVGRGFETVERLEAYTKNHYRFYEFGFWALVEKGSGELAGVAGFQIPEDDARVPAGMVTLCREADSAGEAREGTAGETAEKAAEGAEGGTAEKAAEGTAEASGAVPGSQDGGLCLELGYHIFLPFRRRGLGREACQAILEYGREELGARRFLVRIAEGNKASIGMARSLGFLPADFF